MAAIMMAIKGITAFSTALFSNIKIPQTISSKTTTFNRMWGYGSPNLRKLLANSVLISFINPDVIKTYATTYRKSLIVDKEVCMPIPLSKTVCHMGDKHHLNLSGT